MEHCQGGDLYDNIFFSGHFTERRAVQIIYPIIQAINYLHKSGICHRDIKAENFLFTDKTPNAIVKLIDFGLSCKFGG